ncbi:MAG TPA: hypothetical protein VNB90_03220 [Cytophagaceae bacterium]|jgi:hypothetical protein|nr:hypothetical protein [Cytophagaceae bacterium]
MGIFLGLLAGILWLCTIIRSRINIKLYNSEYGTDFKPHKIFSRDSSVERRACDFTFWYSNVKPQNKKKALVNNILTIVIVICIIAIVSLYFMH